MSRAASGRSGSSGVVASLLPKGTARWLQEYFTLSELPLTALVFLLPMIVLYEVGTLYLTSDWARQTETRVLAFTLMRQFMELFGANGRYLPCLSVVGILLAWHIARRDPWQLQVGTAMGMALESALLAIPLLAIGSLLGRWLPLYATTVGWKGGMVLAIGAGVYEELVFRLIGITLLNILLVDVLRINKRTGYPLIVVLSAVLFAAYHYWSPQSASFRFYDFAFRTICGVYFAILFMARGFGVTAGSHAAYDIYFFVLRAFTGS